VTDSYPPKITISPEGVANLFLMTSCKGAGIETRDALVEIFKLFYERGYEDAAEKTGEQND
jgi:hypothetical protein